MRGQLGAGMMGNFVWATGCGKLGMTECRDKWMAAWM